MKLIYKDDEEGKEGLFSEDGKHQIMMEWEKEYMNACIEKLNPTGRVLEIGFGMGYSADKIQTYKDIESHTIIECNPVVLEKLEEYKKEHTNVIIVQGRWQDVLQTCDNFDSIFFDDYVIDDQNTIMEHNNNMVRFNHFLYEVLMNHTNINARIAVYSGNKFMLRNNIDCIEYDNTEFSVDIPKYCKYVSGDKMYIPIITKISEADKNLKDKIFPKPIVVPQSSPLRPVITPPPPPKCNILIIDNFYNNPQETRTFALKQSFALTGNFPGKRTISFANNSIKNVIQTYIRPCGGEITIFPMEKNDKNYNGSYQVTLSKDRSWIHTETYTNWCGIAFLTPNAPIQSGLEFYQSFDGKFMNEKQIDIYNKIAYDKTKWNKVDNIGNKFNRLVLFRSELFHTCINYFGNSNENGRLFQAFYFSTER